jgi:hypothetical protein
VTTLAAVIRTVEAQDVLQQLGFDAERANERSALVLLALLDLPPDRPWSDATNPMLRTVEIMEWLRAHYSKDYKPNTRETIRRQTLHQFIEAALVVFNPDDPRRAVNSPKNCYQIEPRALELLRSHGEGWDGRLAEYLIDVPGLRDRYAKAREFELIPVTLANGSSIELTPGGQNVLLKQMLEEFCPRWTPGGEVVYIGDAGRDDPIFEKAKLAQLGIELDKHGKLPDLIVYLPDRNWLVLMEAASSHGPVDAKRHGELHDLFGQSTAGLVYVSCFPSRAEMRKYLADIAWETEVWCADNPSHLIHFNGQRFLGPYE